MSVAMKLAYKQDIKDPLVTKAPVTLLMQGDNQANVIELTLMDGATPASLDGYTATVYLQRADGVRVRCPGTVSGNVATVPLQAECYSVPGQYAAIMKLSGPNELRTVLRLAGYVESDGQGVIIDPSGSIPSYEDLERIMQELEEALQQAETAISGANAAAQNANEKAAIADTAAGNANTAAGNANAGAGRANEASESIEGLTVEASDVAYNQPATATVTDVEGHKHIAFGLRQGVPGPVPKLTFTGETGEPNTDVVITQSGPPEAPVVNLKIPQGVPGTGNVSSVDGVVSDTGGNVNLSAVRYMAQTLEDAQKGQARKNIGVDGQIYPCTAAALEAMSTADLVGIYNQGYRAIKTENNGTVVLLGLASDGSLEWLGCNQPRGNLLDNPDFAIAQAGYGGTHGTQVYVADRWWVLGGTISVVKQNDVVILTPRNVQNNVIAQFIENDDEIRGKNVSIFLETNIGISVLTCLVPETGTMDFQTSIIGTSWVLGLYQTDSQNICVRIINAIDTTSISVKRVSMIVGSYTLKTLPPWVAPDPVAELQKCLYYYETIQVPVNARIVATMNNDLNSCKFGVSYNKKRLSSPSIISVSPRYARFIVPGETIQITGLSTVASTDNAAYIDAALQSPTSSPTSGFVDAIGAIGISADL